MRKAQPGCGWAGFESLVTNYHILTPEIRTLSSPAGFACEFGEQFGVVDAEFIHDFEHVDVVVFGVGVTYVTRIHLFNACGSGEGDQGVRCWFGAG